MCGLVGIIGPQPSGYDAQRMLETIRHRGPDGEGTYVADHVAVGHVRLAIVDPSEAGAQPMRTPDGRYCLVYNGELYNHQDFRPALVAKGVAFRGHSDTETLLWLLVHYGEQILPKLHGIFAFAFIDTLTRRTLLARDHLGVKPLYYAQGDSGRLLFASEIKALFATGEVEPRANVEDLLELFLFHFIAGDRTAFAKVSELRPGHSLMRENGCSRLSQFWDPVETARNGSDSGQDLLELLEAGVQRQLMSDVPLGVMSSGGLDSGAVTALAGSARGRMAGFCFRDPAYGYDELEAAQQLSEPFGVAVEGVRIEPRTIPHLLLRLVWHYDEPLPRPHHLAAYAVCERARATGHKVLISGEGGDELFGGYSRYAQIAETMNGSDDILPLVYAHNRVALSRVAEFWPQTQFENDFRFRCAEATDGFDPINRQLLVDQQTFLQHFLQRSDRMGMAAGVEIRVPLLDVPLVEYTNRLPGALKVSAYDTKLCLKRALGTVLPRDVIIRPKTAFEMPMAALLQSGPVAELLDDTLLQRPRCAALFDPRGIARIVARLRAGETDLWKVVWLLLTTELWMRTFRVTV